MLNRKAAEKVTSDLLALIQDESQPLLWQRPWRVSGPGAPANLVNYPRYGCYRGYNALATTAAMFLNGWTCPWFVTFNQAKALGGRVNKGAEGTPILYWKRYTVERETTSEDGESAVDVQTRFVGRCYWVFNAQHQCDGLEIPAPELVEHDPDVTAEEFIAAYRKAAPVVYGGDKAAYIPSRDEVHMPQRGQFESSAAFYATWAHEQAHAATHPTRLNHDEQFHAAKGTEAYALGELIAEMTAAMVCGAIGLPEVLDASAAYTRHFWATFLGEEPGRLVLAAQRAQEVFDFFAGKTLQDANQGVEE